MSDIWDTLHIKYTCDKKLIRRAYAKLLKKYQISKDTQALLLLHEAYELALLEAEHPSSVDDCLMSTTNPPQKAPIHMEFDLDEPASIYEEPDDLLTDLLDLDSDPARWGSPKAWADVLNDPMMKNIDTFQYVRYKLFILLATHMWPLGDHFPPLKISVLLMLDDFFDWSEAEIDLYEMFPEEENSIDQGLALIRFAISVKQQQVELPTLSDWPESSQAVVTDLKEMLKTLDNIQMASFHAVEWNEQAHEKTIQSYFNPFLQDERWTKASNKEQIKAYMALFLYNQATQSQWPGEMLWRPNEICWKEILKLFQLKNTILKRYWPAANRKEYQHRFKQIQQGKCLDIKDYVPFNSIDSEPDKRLIDRKAYICYLILMAIIGMCKIFKWV